jgi:adenine/guanine phosphoribosyltransferase-like PRPP-binding protein
VSTPQGRTWKGTIADTDPTGDGEVLGGTPRQRISNKGGGYVTDVEIVPDVYGHVLQFRAPTGAVAQIRLADQRYRPLKSLGSPRLQGVGARPMRAIDQLLALLSDVLTLPCGDELDYALALDWYKSPVEGHSPQEWPNTSTGDLVHRGKYWYRSSSNAGHQRECGLALVELLVQVVDQHPLLRDVDSIAAVPGHDSKILSFGARLAAAVANVLGKPLVRCHSLTAFRPPAKGLEPSKRAALIHNQFACNKELGGQSLLIVDDVYSSGSTAAEAARAMRAAGATQVASLCAVRTMKS